ncbi:MAG TPA: hypothetical protein VGY31_00760 [Terriglobia bacterium]|nr:hypothetical protein [Terriglobia bacterium]
MMPISGSSAGGEQHGRARKQHQSSGEEEREALTQYLRGAFIHFRNVDVTFRRALNRVRREGAYSWPEVADAASRANQRKIADAIQSIDPFQPRDAKSQESSRLESELAVAEDAERNDLARYLCAAFHACKSREWGFDRILATIGPDPGAPWRSVADLAMAAEARQTTLQ